MPNLNTYSKNLRALQIRWGFYVLASSLVIALFFLQILKIQFPTYAYRWTIQSAIVMLFQLVNLWRFLPQNRRQGEDVLIPRFGPGNRMTLMRGTLIALLCGFILIDKLPGIWAWLPAALYILSDITDFLDGYLARISNTVTRLGETLDMYLDALGVLVVTLLAFQYDTVPWWYLPFGFARYLFLIGLYFHQRRGGRVYPLKPSNTRRLFAGLQMGFITVMLFPVVGPPATTFAATLFLIPFLSMFLIDYLQVTGHDPVRRSNYFAFLGDWNIAPLKIWLLGWAPLILRGVIVLIYGNHALRLGLIIPSNGSTIPEDARPIFLAISLIFMLLFAFGILGRTSSILALIITGIQLQWVNFSFTYWLLVIALIYILFVGNGKFALWNPEEWLITNRAGQDKVS